MAETDTIFAQAGLDVINKFGDSATYTPVSGTPATCTVHLDTDIDTQPDNYSVQARGDKLTIEALVAQIGSDIAVRRSSGATYVEGDRFTIGSDIYEVTDILVQDKVSILCAVRKV